MGISGYGPYDSDASAEWLEGRVHDAVEDLDATKNVEEVRAIAGFIAWAATQVNVPDAVMAAGGRLTEVLEDEQLTPDYADAVRKQVRALRKLVPDEAVQRPRSKLRSR